MRETGSMFGEEACLSNSGKEDLQKNRMKVFIFLTVVIMSFRFRSDQSLSCVRLFATPWTATHQASLSFTISWNLLKFMSITSAMPSNHLVLCHPLFLLPLILPRTGAFSSESVLRIRWPKYWSFSFSIGLLINIQG